MKLTLGQRIKKKRLAYRISLRDLADLIKVSPGTLSRMERDITVTSVRDTTKEQVERWLDGETSTTEAKAETRYITMQELQNYIHTHQKLAQGYQIAS